MKKVSKKRVKLYFDLNELCLIGLALKSFVVPSRILGSFEQWQDVKEESKKFEELINALRHGEIE